MFVRPPNSRRVAEAGPPKVWVNCEVMPPSVASCSESAWRIIRSALPARLVIHELGLEPPRAGNILVRFSSASMKARSLNLVAESELGLAKSF